MLRNNRFGKQNVVRQLGFKKRQELVKLGGISKPENYKIGQHFIHNQVNYRGMILFSIPHQRYIYDQENKDYNIHEEVKIRIVYVKFCKIVIRLYYTCFFHPKR